MSVGRVGQSSVVRDDNKSDFKREMVGVLVLAMVVRLIWFVLIPTLAFEDAYITFRYAQNVRSGLGFVYNAGERVLGTTTPLYTLLLAGFGFVYPDIPTLAKLVNIVFDGISVLAIYMLFARRGKALVGLLGSLLFAIYPKMLLMPNSGMETSLYVCLILLTLLFFVERKHRWAALFVGLLLLTRIDGVMLLFVVAVAYVVQQKKLPWTEAAIWGVVVAPWVIFSFLYFGSLIPSSLVAKLAVSPDMGWGIGRNLRYVVPIVLAGPFGHRLVFLPFFLLGLYRIVRVERWLGPSVGWLFLYYASMVFSRLRLAEWYFYPPQVIYLVITAVGGATALKRLQDRISVPAFRIGTTRRAIYVASVVGILGMTVLSIFLLYWQIKPVQDYEDQVRTPLGLWLKQNTPEGSFILLEPIGYIGYYSERRILDAVALISPQVLPYHQGDLYFPYNLPNVALALCPDYCVFRYPDEFASFRDNPLRTEFEELYKPVLRVAEFVVLERVR